MLFRSCVQSNETLDLASDQGFGGGPDRLESLAQEDAMDAPERGDCAWAKYDTVG